MGLQQLIHTICNYELVWWLVWLCSYWHYMWCFILQMVFTRNMDVNTQMSKIYSFNSVIINFPSSNVVWRTRSWMVNTVMNIRMFLLTGMNVLIIHFFISYLHFCLVLNFPAINECVWVIWYTFDNGMIILVDWWSMLKVITKMASMGASMVSMMRLMVAILEGMVHSGLYSWAMTSLHHLVAHLQTCHQVNSEATQY